MAADEQSHTISTEHNAHNNRERKTQANMPGTFDLLSNRYKVDQIEQ